MISLCRATLFVALFTACRGEDVVAPPSLLLADDPAGNTDDTYSEPVSDFYADTIGIAWYRPWAIHCPSAMSSSTTAEIGPDGGTLALNGHRVQIPAGALRESVALTLSSPAGQFVQVELSAEGRESVFERAASVTISYAQCPVHISSAGAHGAWEIDPASGQPRKFYPAAHDPVERTIEFPIILLSTYAVAY